MVNRIAFMGVILLASFLIFQSCTSLTDLADSLSRLHHLQFKLEGVEGFSIAGIPVSNKTGINDFSLQDSLKLAQLFKSRQMPVEFVIKVAIRNPNDGSAGRLKVNATLLGLSARLLIDNQPTVFGEIESPVEIPGTGEATLIPIKFSLDLFEFFGNQGLDRLLQLALAIGGRNGSSSRLALDVQPRVSTPFGELKYPGRLIIVDKEFR
ncbi:MAG: hypothetical protein WBI18_09840 [Candidatus Saccharicenans sp.]